MACYSYSRVSSSDQVEGTSLDDQKNKTRGAAMMNGLEITKEFVDGGISGAVPLSERPEGSKLVEVLKPGDLVIGHKIDRFFRSASDALVTAEEWKKRGVSLIIADFGADPVTENGTSKLLFGILSMVSEFEKSLLKQRVSDGREAKVAKGGHIGGSTPFGFKKIGEGRGAMLEPIPEEQEAIDLMVEMKARGVSLRAISEQVLETTGFKVSHVAVKNALSRRERLTR